MGREGGARRVRSAAVDVVRGIRSLPLAEEPSVATVGFFDGVHLGHQAVLRTVVRRADERGVRSVAITFDRHPREVLSPGSEPRLLTTVERKAELIAASGVDVLVVLTFDRDFSLITAEDFVREVLVRGVHAVHAAMGANFTFGFKAQGTMRTLPGLATPHGLGVETVELVELGERIVSSTSIRTALSSGDLEWPLGQGIYAGVATHGARRYRAAIDCGTNPTFGVEPLHVESFLLDFEGDLPGEPLSIEFWSRLRDEVRYDSVDELVSAIEADVTRTRQLIPDAAMP
ncbi:MAG: bifunctional riboflavin kinase/FMN adenylyltransferase [Actinobacteria bacterium]|nr:MAG: bifunctional riboflavin kinase/FMN adenylyltransferase [Actinomycetota bacterium]